MGGAGDTREEILDAGCGALGLDVSTDQQALLLEHLDILARWNRTHNLTAVTQPGAMVAQHVLDSLSVLGHVKGNRVLDIGSGGGFPGLPIAITRPDIEVVLLDSRGKRVEFLRFVIGRLGLDNISAVQGRVEDFRPGEKFDTLVARAFSSLSNLLDWTTHLQLPSTRVLAMKGKSPEGELESLPQALSARARVFPLHVPSLDAERHLVQLDY